MDLRLKEIPFELNGIKFRLACTNSVLIEMQEDGGGVLAKNLSIGIGNVGKWVAAMCNASAERDGLDIRITPDDVNRAPLCFRRLQKVVSDLVASALVDPDNEKKETASETEEGSISTGS